MEDFNDKKLDTDEVIVKGKNCVSRIARLSPPRKPVLLRRLRVKPL